MFASIDSVFYPSLYSHNREELGWDRRQLAIRKYLHSELGAIFQLFMNYCIEKTRILVPSHRNIMIIMF